VSRPTKTTRRQNRARILAGTVLVILLIMLFGLGAVLLNVLQPPGAPKPGSLSSGMTWVRSIYGFGARPDQQLLEPIGTAVDGQGRIFVSEPQRSRVLVFRRDGAFDGAVTLMKSHDVAMARPTGLDVDDAGNLYVADRALGRVLVFGPDKQFIRGINVAVDNVKVNGDRLYAINRSHIAVYNLKGELLFGFGDAGREPGKLDGAYALAVGPNGDIYVAESFNKRISVFKPNGEFIRTFGRAATAESGTSTATAKADALKPVFDLPTGLVFDGAGRLVALDAFQFQLEVFDTSGKLIGTYGDEGSTDGKFIYPSGLAYDRASDVFVVTDTRNNRVQVLRIAGSGSPRLDRVVPAALLQPICYGPLALLLAAVVLTVVMMRRRRERNRSAEGAS
jgi:DNA-binding beta-propeller fold protein YncE